MCISLGLIACVPSLFKVELMPGSKLLAAMAVVRVGQRVGGVRLGVNSQSEVSSKERAASKVARISAS